MSDGWGAGREWLLFSWFGVRLGICSTFEGIVVGCRWKTLDGVAVLVLWTWDKMRWTVDWTGWIITQKYLGWDIVLNDLAFEGLHDFHLLSTVLCMPASCFHVRWPS